MRTLAVFLALLLWSSVAAAGGLSPGPTSLAAPGPIGGTTPSTGAFTTISASGQVTSTVSTGTPPFVIASTTQVANLYAARAALADAASALAADPADCSAGTVALGINAAGTAQCTATPSVTSIQGIIGNVTPAAGTFTALTASGQVTVSAGSAAAPTIKITGTTDGFYSPGTGNIGLSIAGSAAASWDVNHLYLYGSDNSLYWNTDGAGTIGQAAANRPNSVFIKTSLGLGKITASGTAPGAGTSKFEVVCGTTAGSAKLVMYAGTSGTAVTVIDNVGSGVTGC